MIDADAAKVDANPKSDAPDASNINTPKIDVKRRIKKPCDDNIVLSFYVYLRQQALHDSQSYGEVIDTGKFDATIDVKKDRGAKKRQQKPDRNENLTQY